MSAWNTILLDAHQCQPIEACGALLGHMDGAGNWLVEEARPLHNLAASPVYFEFEPEELLTVELEQPGRMIGVYHSHPQGPSAASSTDQHNMQRVNSEQHIPWVWFIVSGPFTNQVASNGLAGKSGPLSAQGMIAYYHDQDRGLQQVAIQFQ